MLANGRISLDDFQSLGHHLAQDVDRAAHQDDYTIKYRLSPNRLEVMYKVFNTLELLELILGFLPPVKQLQLRRLCKGFREAIDSSPSIRANMCRTSTFARPSKFELAAIPYSIRGITSRFAQARGARRLLLVMDKTFYATYWRVLRRSAILRSTLLARPSPLYAVIRRDCTCRRVEEVSVSGSDEGLTFGHVFDAFDRIGRRCRVCGTFHLLRVNASYA